MYRLWKPELSVHRVQGRVGIALWPQPLSGFRLRWGNVGEAKQNNIFINWPSNSLNMLLTQIHPFHIFCIISKLCTSIYKYITGYIKYQLGKFTFLLSEMGVRVHFLSRFVWRDPYLRESWLARRGGGLADLQQCHLNVTISMLSKEKVLKTVTSPNILLLFLRC